MALVSFSYCKHPVKASTSGCQHWQGRLYQLFFISLLTLLNAKSQTHSLSVLLLFDPLNTNVRGVLDLRLV